MEQLAARRAHNPKVVGSSPTPAIRFRGVGVNMPACHAGDRRFDPGRVRHFMTDIFYEILVEEETEVVQKLIAGI